MFTNFFKERYESRPEVRLPMPGQPQGFAEGFRALVFQSESYKPKLVQIERPLWSTLSGKIYTIVAHHLSVVVTQYEDGTILWLDDHSSNADFEIFIHREHLLRWLPDNIEEVTDLLVSTKFNFFGWPQLITSTSDIPEMPNRMKKTIPANNQEVWQSIIEAEKRLAIVANQIHPPTCLDNQDKGFELKFYIWTKLSGNIIEINCSFGRDHSFKYQASQLTSLVGFYIIPS